MESRTSLKGWALGLLAGMAITPAAAQAWWNGDWTGRKPLRIDTSAAGGSISEPIGPAVLLVRLHAGNFRFEAAKEDGSDLRFVAGDDKTLLKFHLERYDALLGEGLAWVAIPDLKPGARSEVWLYYGNPKAPSAEDPKGTYDPATSLVYHFAERGQPARDATGENGPALEVAPSADGALIGRGLRLDGTTSVTVPAGPALAWPAGARVTWSAWVRPAEADASGTIFSRRNGPEGLRVGLDLGKPFVEVSGAAGTRRAVAPSALPANGWHHVAVTAGDGVALLVDGSPAARVEGGLPALEGPARLGDDPSARAGAETRRGKAAPPAPVPGGFKGDLDEMQIARVERPSGFLRLSAISQGTDPAKLLAFGQEEEKGGWSSGYLSILIRSVTLDGWVVIGLLAIMAAVSWVVIVGKASYLSAAERADARFTERFRHMSADLVRAVGEEAGLPAAEAKALRDSPLHRIFLIGGEEVRKRTRAGRPLSAEGIEAIRASLDAGLVRESQRLNRRMVLLTIAISGGPFLGLLGTVIGVMITFASIAAAGDVNVNAIAPGIAAALVATVAGLAVAIPALFAYNWLLTRVKDVQANLQVFVDEFVTKAAEAFAADGAGEVRPPRPTIVAAE